MSAGIVVGVLDSGVEGAGLAQLAASRSFVAEPPDADPLGHGSVIARIIVHHAPQARLLDARVFTSRQRAMPERVAAGLEWLRDEHARIVNLSFGLRQDRAVLREAVLAARAAGMVLVGAVPARGATVYPGGYPGVIRVSGDARCAPGEISALGGDPADYGACPCTLDGRPGGASFAAAHVTGMLARHMVTADADPRTLLEGLARFHGRERRLA
jgi:Subtilase family